MIKVRILQSSHGYGVVKGSVRTFPAPFANELVDKNLAEVVKAVEVKLKEGKTKDKNKDT